VKFITKSKRKQKGKKKQPQKDLWAKNRAKEEKERVVVGYIF